jgi:type I restriction enzyme S subunit
MSALPSGWAEAPLNELLSETIGGVWGTPPGSDDVDVYVIRVADFRDNGTFDRRTVPLRSITARQLDSGRLRDGDILLEKSGGGPTKPVGRVVRVPATDDLIVPTNFVQLLRPHPHVEPDYLFWWLWWSHLKGAATPFQRATTNIRNLRTQDYLREPCPVAPLGEQRRIVAAIEEQLSRLDAADDLLRRARRRLDMLLQPLRSQAVADGEEKLVWRAPFWGRGREVL